MMSSMVMEVNTRVLCIVLDTGKFTYLAMMA